MNVTGKYHFHWFETSPGIYYLKIWPGKGKSSDSGHQKVQHLFSFNFLQQKIYCCRLKGLFGVYI